MSEALLELIKETISKIENYEARARDLKAQVNFEHANSALRACPRGIEPSVAD